MNFFQDKLTLGNVLEWLHGKKGKHGNLVDIGADAKIEQALKVLNENGILSLPVYGRPGHWLGVGMNDQTIDTKQGKEYIGIISVNLLFYSCISLSYPSYNVEILDITHWIFNKAIISSGPGDDDDLSGTEKSAKSLKTPVYQVLGQTIESGSLWVTPDSTPLLDVLEPMSKGIHRMLVSMHETTHDRTVTTYQFITQTDILSYFYHNLDYFSSDINLIFSSSIVDLGLVSSHDHDKVVSVWDSTSFTHALRILCTQSAKRGNHDLHSLPIVDPIGNRVIGTFSVSDLRSMALKTDFDMAKLKEMTVGSYLRWIHQLNEDEDLHLPRVCHRSTSLFQVIGSLLQPSVVHRLWIIESEEEHAQNLLQPSLSDENENQNEIFFEVEELCNSTKKISETAFMQMKFSSTTSSQPRRICGVVSMTDIISSIWERLIKKRNTIK